MALSKLEIQQMLREMNVKFDADETYEELRLRLQQENHHRWLKSGSENRSASGDRMRAVVRKRRKDAATETEPDESETPTAGPTGSSRSNRRSAADHGGASDRGYRPRPIDKPPAGEHWKAAADGTVPFNRAKNVFDSVLKRAKNRCERCAEPAGEGAQAIDLQPFYLQPLAQGGEHSIKNMVALCAACHEVLQTNSSSKDIKELKRKTRSRLYDSLQVVRKKNTPVQRQPSSQRK